MLRPSQFTIKVRIIASMVVMVVVSTLVVVWYITGRTTADARDTGFAYAGEVAQRNAAEVREVVLSGLGTARDMAQVLDASRSTPGSGPSRPARSR
uniref:hypothetical protein n=1 Tax=Paractinoplanes polyasparticus TaxID=2856853 RepID=UPI002103493C|nr:hypothetical protein [Actinoplanes polyasparticus]